ncbi:MAG: hypothetical protein HY661_16045, partial [Betaproteobacteria bacterium]|nr:hypothetical protein [Betaproteobacteria bacterium]
LISTAADVLAASTIAAASLVQSAGTGTTTLTDNVTTTAAAGVDLTAGAITLAMTNIDTSANGVVRLNGPVALNNDLVINTTNGGGTGGTVTFTNTLDSVAAHTLGVTAGTTGDVLFQGAVGNTDPLGAVTINSANNFTVSDVFKAASLVQSAGEGTTLLSGPVTASTATGVQITATDITVGSSGGITTTAGSVGVVALTISGALDINAPINADGDVTVNGLGATTLNADIVTTSDLVQFSQPVLLTGNRLIDTTAADTSGSGGAIQFLSTVDGATNSLTLAAPTVSGDISFNQTAGNLSALTVTSGRNFSTAATAPITAGSGGISVTVGGTATINGTLTTSSSGGVSFANGGLLTLNASIDADGAVAQTGAGLVTINTDRTITTTADAVSFATDVTLNRTSGTGLLTIDTTSGNAAGNNITFSGKLGGTTAGAEPVTLNAGTAGNVLFGGLLGDAMRLGAINITNANNVTANGVRAASLVQSDGSGTTTLNSGTFTDAATEALKTNASAGVSITNTGGIAVNGNVSNSAGGDVTLTTTGVSGDIIIAANTSVVSTGGNGAMSLNAGRHISLGDAARVITTSGAAATSGTFGTGTGTVSLNAGQAAATAGNIALNQDAVVQSDLGAIGLGANNVSGGTITMVDKTTGTQAARLLSAAGAVTLGARTDVQLGETSTGSTVDVTATSGSISDNTTSEAIANITGTNVTLTAGGKIGDTTAGADIDTNIAAVTATAGGNAVLREIASGGDLSIGLSGAGISSSGGEIAVRVDAGTLNVTQNITTTGTGNIDLRAVGTDSDINVNNGGTISSGSGTLQLVAGQSILTDSANSTSTELQTAGKVLLDAVNAIGTEAKRIEMKDVATAAARITGAATTGDIYLRQLTGNNNNNLEIGSVSAVGTGAASLSGITTANNNDISVTAVSGSLTVTQNVTAHGSGNVDLRTGGSSSDINLNNSATGATVSSTSGTLQLVAGRSILTDSANGTSTELQTSGSVLLKAGDAIGTDAKRIETKEVAKVAAMSAGASTAGDIYLRQLAGTNSSLEIGSVSAVNSASTLDNTVSNLNGITTGANSNDITVTVAAGSLNVTQNVTAHGSGNVDLRTGGLTSDINLNNSASGAMVSSTSGTLQLVAGRSILTDSANGTSTELQTSGKVLLKAGDAIGTDAKRIEMKEVAKVAALSAGASTVGDIYLRQLSGTNSNLEVGPVTAVNAASNLDNTVSGLNGITTSANSNDISVTVASGSLTLTQNVTAHGSGYVDLRTGGSTSDININNSASGATVSSTSGTLQLVAGRSILTDSANGTSTELQTAGNVLLKAGDAVGTDAKRIEMKEVAKAAAVSAGASTTGDIYLRQLAGTNSSLEIGAVSAVNAGSILDNTVSNLNGITTSANSNDIAVTVAAGSLNLTQDVGANGSGNVDLRTGGSASDININNGATVSSGSGMLQLVAGRSILTDSANGTSTELQTSGNVLLRAGDAIGTDAKRIEMKEVAKVAAVSAGASTAGDIYLRQLAGANGNLEIGSLSAVNAGSILDNTVSNLSGITTNANDITVTVAAGSLTVTQNVTAHGSGNVDLRTGGSASDININNGATISSTSGTLQLVAGRSILTDSITGTATELSTSGGALLDAVDAIGIAAKRIDTDVGTLAARVTGSSTAGDVFLNQVEGTLDALTVGSVNAVNTASSLDNSATGLSGVATANGNDILLATTSGTLTLAQNLSAGAGNIGLVSGSNINQTGGTITANQLGMRAVSGIGASQAGNNANAVAATTTGAGTIVYRDSDSFQLATVSVSGALAPTSGLSANSGASDITLTSGGAVTQASAADNILAAGLELKGAGPYALTNSANHVSTLAGAVTVAVSYTDSGSFAVGTVSTVGLTAGGISLSSLGAGTMTVNDRVATTSGGTLNLTNASTLSINADVSSDGAITQNGAGAVTIASPRAITTTGDAVTFAQPVTLSGSGATSIDTTTGANPAGANITFASTLDGATAGAEHLSLTAGTGGDVLMSAAVGATQRVGDILITNARNVTESSGLTARSLTQLAGTNGATTRFDAAVDTNGVGGVNIATSGTVNVAGTLTSNDNPIALSGSDWVISGAINAGTAPITLSHWNNGTVNIGSQVDSGELALLSTSDSLFLGAPVNSGIVNIDGSVTFVASTPNVVLRATGAGGAITQTNPSAITGAPATLLTLTADSGIGQMDAPLRVAGGNFSLNNASAGDAVLQVTSGNANFTGNTALGLTRFRNAAAGGALDVSVTDGKIIHDAQLASAGPLSLSANSNGSSATITVNAAGISADGDVTLRSADALTIDSGSGIDSRGNIALVAGKASGMTAGTAYGDGSAFIPITPAVAPSDAGPTPNYHSAGVLINGPVRASGAAPKDSIAVYAAGPVTQSISTDAGLQTRYSDPLADGVLRVVTFNDSGSAISLKNNLNTGSGGVCPGIAGTGNCVGPLILETRYASGEATAAFASGNIDYNSINGTTVFGVGTAANVTFIAPSHHISTGNINGKNVYFYAEGSDPNAVDGSGNISLDIQIKNSDINRGAFGGSLNLIADGDINVNNPGNAKLGVSIGERTGTTSIGEPIVANFEHDLKLVASGSINVSGSIYMQGDLNLRADASQQEVKSLAVDPTPALGAGKGSVSISVPATSVYPVEVKANSVLIGAEKNGVLYPVKNVTLAASSTQLPVDGSGMQTDAVLSSQDSMDIYLTGDLSLVAGTTSAVTTGATTIPVRSSAVAAIEGHAVTIKGLKVTDNLDLPRTNSTNMTLQAGTASANNVAGSGAFASADAVIFAKESKSIDIGGDLTLLGGTTARLGSAVVAARAAVDPSVLDIKTGGNVVLIGGFGTNASASITNVGDIVMTVGGNLPVTYTNTELGLQTTPVGGLVIVGAPLVSGVFDSTNRFIGVEGSPVQAYFTGGGAYRLYLDAGRAEAYVQSGTLRNFESLQRYLIFAANEETKRSRVLRGLGAGDDANLPSCN